jgi:sugar-specific transcriptional regulator TrmB
VSTEEDVATLMELGLTLLQARIYLALVSSGTTEIKSLAKITGIAKHDVYRIMPNLQVLGLAEKIVAPNATYKAVPIQDAASTLLLQKTKEHDSLQKKTVNLVSHYKSNSIQIPVQEEESYFRIISEKFLLVRTLDSITDSTKETIDFAHTWEFIRGMLFKHSPIKLLRALERGVRIRWITETHDEEESTEEALKILTANSLFKIRYFPRPIPLRLAVYDQKETIMSLSSSSNNWMSSIWSNNKMFAIAIANYHEQMWNSATEENTKELSTNAQAKEKS